MELSFQYRNMCHRALVLIMLFISTAALSAPKPKDTSGSGEITDCTILVEPGIYSVTQDLPASGGLLSGGDCILVEAANVTINLNNHTITGGGSGAAVTDGGVALENITIRSGTVTGFENGVALSAS